jgi:hypothetical protein
MEVLQGHCFVIDNTSVSVEGTEGPALHRKDKTEDWRSHQV